MGRSITSLPGQAQKEAFVNAAHARSDLLLHPVIEGEAAAPPQDPQEGECWLVSAQATGAFAGMDSRLACRQVGVWLFAIPIAGMRVFDRATGQHIVYFDEWRREVPPPAPTGGTTVDVEARGALEALTEALRRSGVFPEA